MYKFPIGVLMDSFKLDTRSSILKAKELGACGIQMYATKGENSPEELTVSKRKELLDFTKSNGMFFSALCGDLGMGFYRKERNPELIEKSKRILDLAKELETDIVTTHIGVVPENKNNDRYKIIQDACFELSVYADSINSHFAIETGPEKSATLKSFLDELGSTGVGVNLDPANLVMVTGDDPIDAVYNLRRYIVHTHAKDGIKLYDLDPEIIYGVIQKEKEITSPSFKEVPLGKGSVKFKEYLAALDDIGYRGFLTIERECGENPAEDIKIAIDYLNDIISNN